MSGLIQDFSHGFRLLLKSPGFTLIAVIVLALGTGANTAIFSVVDAVLWRPLPYEGQDRLVTVQETNLQTGGEPFKVSLPNFRDWREQNHVFEGMAAVGTTGQILTGRGDPARLTSALVSAELFPLLSARAELGRTLLPEDDREGAAPVAVMSHRLWTRQLGADPGAVGKTITLDGDAFTLVGVMPPGFSFPSEETDLWIALDPYAKYFGGRSVHTLRVVARLRPSVTPGRALAEMRAIAARIEKQDPSADPAHSVAVTPLRESMVGDFRTALLVLFGAVAFVLFIACANVAHLLLARAAERRKEIAVRAALGASRWRLLRGAFAESLLLALAGGGAGLCLALWGVDILRAGTLDFIPLAREAGVDARVLTFTLALSLLTGILSGVAAAAQFSGLDLSEALKADAAGKSKSGGQRLRRSLVVAELALSLILLVGAGLMIQSLWSVLTVDPGFRPDHMMTMSVSLPGGRFEPAEKVIAWYRELPERLNSLPGVQSVSAVSALPISGGDANGDLTIEGRSFNPGEAPPASFRRILPSYFSTMGISLKQGREFDDHDPGPGDRVVIVNDSMARRFWPAGDAVGKRIKVGPAEREPWLTIVGVVADVRNVGLDLEPAFATYEPHAQRPWSSMNVVVRAGPDASGLAAAIRNEIREKDADILVDRLDTMAGRISASVAGRRLNMVLLLTFALLALVLAAVGVYGVIAFAVSRRTREIGIRLALGARRKDILKLVVGEGAALAAAGAGIGLAGAAALTHFLKALLFSVTPLDLPTFLAVPLVLTAAALLACYVPARRALKVDPAVALRIE